MSGLPDDGPVKLLYLGPDALKERVGFPRGLESRSESDGAFHAAGADDNTDLHVASHLRKGEGAGGHTRGGGD